jgi:hypothetical protein
MSPALNGGSSSTGLTRVCTSIRLSRSGTGTGAVARTLPRQVTCRESSTPTTLGETCHFSESTTGSRQSSMHVGTFKGIPTEFEGVAVHGGVIQVKSISIDVFRLSMHCIPLLFSLQHALHC